MKPKLEEVNEDIAVENDAAHTTQILPVKSHDMVYFTIILLHIAYNQAAQSSQIVRLLTRE